MNPVLADIAPPPIPFFKAKAKGRRSPALPYADMTQAVPPFPTFSAIRECLKRDLDDPEMSFYTDVPGLLSLREATAQRHPLAPKIHADQLLITCGANHAMYTALTLLFTIGDTVTLLEPYYFNHDMNLSLLGLKADRLALDPEQGFTLRAEAVIAHLQKTGSRGVILISPNNPTGATYSATAIETLVQWCAANQRQVILDETYLRFDPHHLQGSHLVPFLGNGLTLVGSFSKNFSMTGYRVGYLISSPEGITEACKIQDTMVICPPALGQRAALHGLELCDTDVAQVLNEFAHRRELLKQRTAPLRQFRLVSSGAYFGYLAHPFAELSSEAAALKLFDATGILGLPGEVFGQSQRGFIRLSFANLAVEPLGEAMDRLVRYDQNL